MNRFGDILVHAACNEDLLRALHSHQTEFVVIGGLAISWHCVGRQADDLDLMLNPSLSNSKRVVAALRTLGITGLDDDSFVKKGVHLVLKRSFYADLLTPQADALQYPEITANAELAQLHQVSVSVASVEALLKMKTWVVETEDGTSIKHQNDILLLQEKLKANFNT